jgi:hypothetical protein
MVDAAVQIRLDALFRMWESLAIRQLGVLEIVGSNPAILILFETAEYANPAKRPGLCFASVESGKTLRSG